MTQSLAHVMTVYRGSDGEATKALYAQLERAGPLGVLALNLFRAQKNSERAKEYRGGNSQGSYRGQAYDRKAWAMENLTRELASWTGVAPIIWGWGEDAAQEFHRWVLYVELPNGQVSFHTGTRGKGPDYTGKWDGIRNASPQRICAFCAQVLDLHSPESKVACPACGGECSLDDPCSYCDNARRVSVTAAQDYRPTLPQDRL